MRLYSYILTYDGGSTPNPFHGTCTLAVCKPAIRRTASVGDWIMATGPTRAATKNKLIFAMRVDDILPLEKYFEDPRFQSKRPDPTSDDPRRRAGDNMYSQRADGRWIQSAGPRNADSADKDVSGKNALLSTHFYYFGTNAIPFPTALESLIHKNQGHRCQFPEELIAQFVQWLESKQKPGIHGEPSDPPP